MSQFFEIPKFAGLAVELPKDIDREAARQHKEVQEIDGELYYVYYPETENSILAQLSYHIGTGLPDDFIDEIAEYDAEDEAIYINFVTDLGTELDEEELDELFGEAKLIVD